MSICIYFNIFVILYISKIHCSYISKSFFHVFQNIYYSLRLNLSVVLFHFVVSKTYCCQCAGYVYLQFTAHKVKVFVLVTKLYSVNQVRENEFFWGGEDLARIRGNRKAWKVFVVKHK